MLPFDRLIKEMDRWSALSDDEVFAQIGAGRYIPSYMKYARIVEPGEFRRYMERADVVVAHAGMGCIIQARQAQRPIVLFPRRAALSEHTTDHQLHTLEHFGALEGVYVARKEAELQTKIDEARHYIPNGEALSAVAPAAFVARIRAALFN